MTGHLHRVVSIPLGLSRTVLFPIIAIGLGLSGTVPQQSHSRPSGMRDHPHLQGCWDEIDYRQGFTVIIKGKFLYSHRYFIYIYNCFSLWKMESSNIQEFVRAHKLYSGKESRNHKQQDDINVLDSSDSGLSKFISRVLITYIHLNLTANAFPFHPFLQFQLIAFPWSSFFFNLLNL